MNMEEEKICKSLDETQQFAIDFAKSLKVGDIVLLSGDLGAGKTFFTKGIALGLGIKQMVQSPTFTIMNSYDNLLYHFDLYRLKSFDELLGVGAEEYLYGNGICVLEWPECVGIENFPKNSIIVKITKIDDTTREIKIRRGL